MHLRRFLALVALPLLAIAVVACNGGKDSATSSPIILTASITLTASPEVTESPTPAGTVSDEAPRRSGDLEVDAIIEAFEQRDMATLAGLIEYQVIGCTHELGMGGPPKCDERQPEGEELRVFPVAGCEGTWTNTATQLVGFYAFRARGLYAVVEPAGPADLGGQWPASDTLLVFHVDPSTGGAGFRIHVAAGRIVALWTGCGAGEDVSSLVAAGVPEGAEVTAGPWDAAAETVSDSPTTGIEAIDGVLAAVARYDVSPLAEGARAAMQDIPDVACQELPIEGPGGVECDGKNGEVAGDEVSVFPVAYCEGVLARDPMPELRAFLDMAPALYAVVEAPDEPSQSALYPHGAYWLVYELQAAPGDTQAGARLHVTAEGNVTALWFGCAPPLEQLGQWRGEPLPEIEVREE